ncbi:MAG: PEP-CTERM sorting domain-containing protein [Phycisphaerales bacterium]|jgi:hypothetical protein
MRYVSFGAVAALAMAAAAQGSILSPGVYLLGNHPDGTEVPPPYGLRLDELVDVTSGHDVFSFDFDHAGSLVQLVVTPTTLRIVGNVYGGRDVGSAYANDQYKGFYGIDFLYNIGVAQVPGDDDIYVHTANHSNFGSITLPAGASAGNGTNIVNLVDERGNPDNGTSLRIGNEDNDLGHRGFAGVSGWGWISYVNGNNDIHVTSSDWLFRVVPTPGSAMLLGAGVLAIGRRRR